MNIIYNNAKALIQQKALLWHRFFLPVVTLNFSNKFIHLSQKKKHSSCQYAIEFDPQYIHQSYSLDVRYFTKILQKICTEWLKSKNVYLRFRLPLEWGLPSSEWNNSLAPHQQERNIILHFQKEYVLPVSKYEYILDFHHKCSLAVRKEFLHNWLTCCENLGLNGVVVFEIDHQRRMYE